MTTDSATKPNKPGAQQGSSVAIIGAGAVAGLMSSWLQRAGHPPPVVCARSFFDAFTVIGDGSGHHETRRCPVVVITSPEQAAPVDWIFVTVDPRYNAELRPWFDALADQHTVVVVLQEGVDHAEGVRSMTDIAEIVPALVFATAERNRPATIRHLLGALITVPNTSAARSFAKLMAGGVHVAITDDFLTESWRRLLVNIGTGPIAALTLRNVGVLRVPLIERLCLKLLTEVRSVGEAVGANITDADIDGVMWLYRCHPNDVDSSRLYDRLAGGSLDYDSLLASVLRHALAHQIVVPVTKTLFTQTTVPADLRRNHHQGRFNEANSSSPRADAGRRSERQEPHDVPDPRSRPPYLPQSNSDSEGHR